MFHGGIVRNLRWLKLSTGLLSSILFQVQVVKVESGKLTCCAQNDATLDGLITVIHSEQASDGMSSSRSEAPCRKQASKFDTYLLQPFAIEEDPYSSLVFNFVGHNLDPPSQFVANA